MNSPQQITPKVTPKAKQFNEELNELLGKYQYTLVPELQTTVGGIKPIISIKDVLPPKEKPVSVPTKAKRKLSKKVLPVKTKK